MVGKLVTPRDSIASHPQHPVGSLVLADDVAVARGPHVHGAVVRRRRQVRPAGGGGGGGGGGGRYAHHGVLQQNWRYLYIY